MPRPLVALLLVATPLALSSSCPTKVGCPLCYDMMEAWNTDKKLPDRMDDYCRDVVAPGWRAKYETLTGKQYVASRERTRCIAVAAGLQDQVRQGCHLPSCAPQVACATFC